MASHIGEANGEHRSWLQGFVYHAQILMGTTPFESLTLTKLPVDHLPGVFPLIFTFEQPKPLKDLERALSDAEKNGSQGFKVPSLYTSILLRCLNGEKGASAAIPTFLEESRKFAAATRISPVSHAIAMPVMAAQLHRLVGDHSTAWKYVAEAEREMKKRAPHHLPTLWIRIIHHHNILALKPQGKDASNLQAQARRFFTRWYRRGYVSFARFL